MAEAAAAALSPRSASAALSPPTAAPTLAALSPRSAAAAPARAVPRRPALPARQHSRTPSRQPSTPRGDAAAAAAAAAGLDIEAFSAVLRDSPRPALLTPGVLVRACASVCTVHDSTRRVPLPPLPSPSPRPPPSGTHDKGRWGGRGKHQKRPTFNAELERD